MLRLKSDVFSKFFTPVLIVSALGYFVDAFDIVIFSIVRVSSLTELGFSGDLLTQKGLFLMNMQLGGMLVGGVLWGCIGDRKGRSAALIFSILCYSLANIANGFVESIEAYAICRFVSGIGLAGELGAAVTLVMEGLPKNKRGIGAMVVTVLGALGALTAALTGGFLYWRHLYILGGAMGLVLLFARSSIKDSKMFIDAKSKNVSRGNVLDFFKNFRLFKKFIACFLIGIPHYLFFGVLVTLSPEIAKEMGLAEPISVTSLLVVYAVFLCFGDLSATLFSQFVKSRKKAVVLFAAIACMALISLYVSGTKSVTVFYTYFGLMGFFAGYVMLVPVIAAETFGTNLRVTATSTITNCVRASAILMNVGVAHLKYLGIVTATQIVAGIVMTLALVAAFSIKETFSKDMEFFD